MNKKQNKNTIISLFVLAVAVIVLLVGYQFLKPRPVKGEKTLKITVVSEDQSETEYEFQTDAEYLQQAMDEAEGLTYSGTESEFGMMIEAVNGTGASYDENGAYWAFYVNDEFCNYGISEQPVEDGDEFRIVYTSGE